MILRSIFEPILVDLGSVFRTKVRPCWAQNLTKIRPRSFFLLASVSGPIYRPIFGTQNAPRPPQDLPNPPKTSPGPLKDTPKTPQRPPKSPQRHPQTLQAQAQAQARIILTLQSISQLFDSRNSILHVWMNWYPSQNIREYCLPRNCSPVVGHSESL